MKIDEMANSSSSGPRLHSLPTGYLQSSALHQRGYEGGNLHFQTGSKKTFSFLLFGGVRGARRATGADGRKVSGEGRRPPASATRADDQAADGRATRGCARLARRTRRYWMPR
ncbi:hypothetical protein X946_5252 [Burkholderia sp. ABCPW 111]|nr:hypothetical protein X946_5252 [Burkholderia sp. ABCPW 111]